MRYLKYLAFLPIFMLSAAVPSHAQRVIVGVGVGPGYIGAAPACAYGYYGYYPYDCAPYGYWGPDYFTDGIFIGAGPRFNGFYGRGYYGRGYYGRGYGGRGFYGRGGWDNRGRDFGGRRDFDRRGFRGGDRGGFRGDSGFPGWR